MGKSAIYAASSNASTVAAGGNVPIDGVVRRYGCALSLNGDSVTVAGGGCYSVSVALTAAPTAAGTVVATLLKDGQAVPGARAAATANAAGDSVSLSFPAVVRAQRCCGGSSLSVALTGGEATVGSVAVEVTSL